MFIAIETLRMEAHSHSRFECIQCNRTFTRKEDLLRHKKSIHDKLSYTCGRCFKTFSRADVLKRHQKSCNRITYVCSRFVWLNIFLVCSIFYLEYSKTIPVRC